MFKKQNSNPSTTTQENRPMTSSSAPSLIGSDIRIVGNISTPGEVQLDGVIEGDIVCGALTIGEHGIVTGTVKAETLNLRGQVEGKLNAKIVHLQKTARVLGDVTYETMTMEAGVQVQGKLVPKKKAAAQTERKEPSISAPAEKQTQKKNGNGAGEGKLPL